MNKLFVPLLFLILSSAFAASEPKTIQQYREDQRLLVPINIEIRQIWGKLPEAKSNHAGDRSLKALELKISKSKSEALVYLKKNRKYFDLNLDLGGGAFADSNWERLKEDSKNPQVLSFFHGLRFKEVSNVPYCPLECEFRDDGCGDSDDGTVIKLKLVEKVFQDFPQTEFKVQHRKLLADYQNSIDEFQNGKRDGCEGSPKSPKDAKIVQLLQPLKEILKRLDIQISK